MQELVDYYNLYGISLFWPILLAIGAVADYWFAWSNVKVAAFVYADCIQRGIKPRKWVYLALFFNVLGKQIYFSYTARPQTSMSLSPAGLIVGDKFEKKHGRELSWVLLGSATVSFIILGYKFINGNDLGTGDVGGAVLTLAVTFLMVLYFGIAAFKPGKVNILDKPVLGGMGMTNEGPVDESLTKHKSTANMLLVIILVIFISLIAYFLFIFE